MNSMQTLFTTYGYLLFLFLFAVLLIVSGIYFRKIIVKQICFSLAAIFIAFMFYEIYLMVVFPTPNEKGSVAGTYSAANYFGKSDLLGYKPRHDGIFTSKKTSSTGRVVYDVTYTIKNGIRFTPNSNDTSTLAALFFGCSVTFGEGVPDTSTLPYLFNECVNRQYQVLNFGFHGYGPHQMLAIVENKLDSELVARSITKGIAFYGFIPDHIRRCAGYNKWDLEGPRYEVMDGNLQRVGNFDKTKPLYFGSKTITEILTSSFTYKSNFAPEYKKATHKDVVRTIEVIRRADSLVRSKGLKFNVIAWNHKSEVKLVDKGELDFFYETLKRYNIRVFFISDIVNLKTYEMKPDFYSIKNDGHPTVNFYRVVAGGISKQGLPE